MNTQDRDADMASDPPNAIDTSAEAALELEELKLGLRDEVPAFHLLFKLIQTPVPSPEFEGRSSMSMLADLRSYALLRDSVGNAGAKSTSYVEMRDIVERYLAEIECGVSARQPDKIEEAKRFCISFNGRLLANELSEIYDRREYADSRYMTDASLS